MGMEGTPKLTQEQLEMNKTRAETLEKMRSYGADVRVGGNGEIEIAASKYTVDSARSEMKQDLENRAFMERGLSLIGKKVNFSFNEPMVLALGVAIAMDFPGLDLLIGKRHISGAELQSVDEKNVHFIFEGKSFVVNRKFINDLGGE